MSPVSRRTLRVAITRVSYDIVSNATTDTGVAKLTGPATLMETGEEIGPVDLTFWGSTPGELKERARNWPARFDAVAGEYFGVSDFGEGRFDLFLSAERFFRLLDLAHGSRRASIRLGCEVSEDGSLDLVHEMEISASRG